VRDYHNTFLKWIDVGDQRVTGDIECLSNPVKCSLSTCRMIRKGTIHKRYFKEGVPYSNTFFEPNQIK